MVEDRLSLIFRQRLAYNGNVTLLLANEAFAFLPKLITNVLWHLRNERNNLVRKCARHTLRNIIELNCIERNCQPVDRGGVVENHGVSRSAKHPLKLVDICDMQSLHFLQLTCIPLLLCFWECYASGACSDQKCSGQAAGHPKKAWQRVQWRR